MSETQTYLVEWQMHVEADNPATAARQAWEHVRRKDSTATVFDVIGDSGEKTRVDLMELEEWNQPAEPDPTEAAYRTAVKELHNIDGECEIDDGAVVSISDDGGAYIQAWLWISDEEANICWCCRKPIPEGCEVVEGQCSKCVMDEEEQDDSDKSLLIEIYAMKSTGNGEATLAPDRETPDFWDVMVRYDGEDPIEEHENLSEHTVAPLIDGLQRKFPNAIVAEAVGG